jgi:hypothetical protein
LGTTGTSIFGGGIGAGSGAVKADEPGGRICAQAALPAATAGTIAKTNIIEIELRFIPDMS